MANKMITWQTMFTLYRDGKRIGGQFFDYWDACAPIAQETQERFWMRIYDGYSIAHFACIPYDGTDPNPQAHRSLDVGTF